MTTIKLLETPPTSAADEDSGFGALSTDKGNLPLESLDVRLSAPPGDDAPDGPALPAPSAISLRSASSSRSNL